MSKANDQPSEMNTEPAPVDKPGWILLQEARLAQGMDIEPLAAILKIPARKIEALEAGALSGVGDLTFSRALAGSICRQLRIDAKPILAAWPTRDTMAREVPLNLPNDGAASAATALPPEATTGSGGRVVWAVLVLILVGIGAWLAVTELQRGSERREKAVGAAERLAPETGPGIANQLVISPVEGSSSDSGADDVKAAKPVLAAPVKVAPVKVAPVTAAATATSPPATSASAASLDAPANVATPPLTPPPPVPTEVVPVAPTPTVGTVPVQKRNQPLSSADIGQHALVLSAVTESWVEVTDRSGTRVFTRLMSPGDYVVLGDEDLPYNVLVGNAVGVRVFSRGQPVDVQATARLNVSRFDVN
ncbi:helix-turn-helix domain-containing protein [Burkholderiaceae bacterium]|nr:helix-turn-helix domain-containing protein [Burkholderiaceae bacterium]